MQEAYSKLAPTSRPFKAVICVHTIHTHTHRDTYDIYDYISHKLYMIIWDR